MKVILSVADEGYSDRTWWMLLWPYLMKVIMIVPDEGYWSYLMKVIDRTWWMSLIVPDEGYWSYLMKVIMSVPDEGYDERTWWRLLWA